MPPCYRKFVTCGVAPPTSGVVYRNVGEKFFELKDHLGNVRVVVGDRKNLDVNTDELTANVVAYNNYYPFGMPQPSRNFDSQEYRYGFQGQEKDSEIKGEGLSVNYKYRMHDPRLGRFFAVDPLFKKYPYFSSYQFSGNRVVDAIELEGLEYKIVSFTTPEIEDLSKEISIYGRMIARAKSLGADQTASSYTQKLNVLQERRDQLIIKMFNSDDVKAMSNIDLSGTVLFVSQFELERPNVACCRASQKILNDFGLENSGSITNRMIVARNNSDNTALDILPNARKGVEYIDSQLEIGNPVMVGVNHNLEKGQADKEAADHFVVITGRGTSEGGDTYYNFYEVGTKHENRGKSDKNKLFLQNNSSLKGTNYDERKTYIVTDIRKNEENNK